MIRYDLECPEEHRFDAWFRSSADFDAQAAGRLMSCPHCGSAEIRKTLMAPAIAARREAPAEASSQPQEVALLSDKERTLRAMLREVRQQLTANSEDVGDRFPEVARQMHGEEIERRSIHGRATAEEAKALVEEGVEVHPLPHFPDETN